MATFVHVTSAKHIRGIRNAGIKAQRTFQQDVPKGVYALPVVPNNVRTHQWGREIKRGVQQRVMYAVYFRIPDTTLVWSGRYNQPHQQITAAEAAALLMDENTPLGFEVIIPRAISPAEITRIRYLSKLSGWRYYPGAHGRAPCSCPVCLQRGEFKAQRIRERDGISRRKRKSQNREG
jgi:hypothetical protein